MVNHVKRQQRTIQCITKNNINMGTTEWKMNMHTNKRDSFIIDSHMSTWFLCQSQCKHRHLLIPAIWLPKTATRWDLRAGRQGRGSATHTRVGHTHAQHNHIKCSTIIYEHVFCIVVDRLRSHWQHDLLARDHRMTMPPPRQDDMLQNNVLINVVQLKAIKWMQQINELISYGMVTPTTKILSSLTNSNIFVAETYSQNVHIFIFDFFLKRERIG